uniref:Uncharacterized protein n=1 Tax=Sphaerodactylus townsendi TaxID=933632 RepID=A0ACB8FUT0_9SAUR
MKNDITLSWTDDHSIYGLRCSTGLGTDRRAIICCSRTVSQLSIISGPPDKQYQHLSYGDDSSTERPSHY